MDALAAMRRTGGAVRMDLHAVLRRVGGAAPTRTLLELGLPRRGIDAAVRRGDLLRIRRGWYGVPELDDATRAAVRAGGVVTCITLLEACGVWVLPQQGAPHVAVSRSSSGRLPRSAVVCHAGREVPAGGEVRDTIVGALRTYARCYGVEHAVAAADSALRVGVLDEAELVRLPVAVRRRVDPTCESGGESIVRQRLASLRVRFRMQVRIAGVGRVDFVIGDRLVLEVDGYAFHGGRVEFERDRARDLAALAAGYLVIRVSQRQVLEEWPRIERAVLALVRSGRHRWPRRAQ